MVGIERLGPAFRPLSTPTAQFHKNYLRIPRLLLRHSQLGTVMDTPWSATEHSGSRVLVEPIWIGHRSPLSSESAVGGEGQN